MPSLTTYKPPAIKTPVTEAQKKTLRSRKIAWDSFSARQQRPFNFLRLPAELRIKIYEMCVSVSEYIEYDERDYCTCGGERHLSEAEEEETCTCTFVEPSYREGFTRRQPGCFYLMSPHHQLPEGPFASLSRHDRKVHANARMTPMPPILEANSQIRDEALPIFYAMNDFVLEDCDCSWVSRWLYNGVQRQHLKHIKSITWDGSLDSDTISSLTDNSFVQVSSIIMLMQLGILGRCKIRLLPEEDVFDNIHFACILHDKISKLVQRKALTPADAENESSELDEFEVNGLVYCISKKLSDLCKQLHKSKDLLYRTSGLGGNSNWKANCSCPDLEGKMSWIEMKSLPVADDAASLPRANGMQQIPAVNGTVQNPVVVDDD